MTIPTHFTMLKYNQFMATWQNPAFPWPQVAASDPPLKSLFQAALLKAGNFQVWTHGDGPGGPHAFVKAVQALLVGGDYPTATAMLHILGLSGDMRTTNQVLAALAQQPAEAMHHAIQAQLQAKEQLEMGVIMDTFGN